MNLEECVASYKYWIKHEIMFNQEFHKKGFNFGNSPRYWSPSSGNRKDQTLNFEYKDGQIKLPSTCSRSWGLDQWSLRELLLEDYVVFWLPMQKEKLELKQIALYSLIAPGILFQGRNKKSDKEHKEVSYQSIIHESFIEDRNEYYICDPEVLGNFDHKFTVSSEWSARKFKEMKDA